MICINKIINMILKRVLSNVDYFYPAALNPLNVNLASTNCTILAALVAKFLKENISYVMTCVCTRIILLVPT